jgi:hypothetical protein
LRYTRFVIVLSRGKKVWRHRHANPSSRHRNGSIRPGSPRRAQRPCRCRRSPPRHRRKIILGGLLIDAASKDKRFAGIVSELTHRISRDQDQKPFEGGRCPGGSLMDRDREDDPRRCPPARQNAEGGGSGGRSSRSPPARSTRRVRHAPIRHPLPPIARGAADAAQAHSFFSHLDTNIQRILTGFGTLRDLVSDVRASLADAAARDAQRAEDGSP